LVYSEGMTNTAADNLRAIAENATRCPTCGGTPNADNFGGMCDPCQTKASERLIRAAALLRSRGITEGHEARTLIAAGDRAEKRLGRG